MLDGGCTESKKRECEKNNPPPLEAVCKHCPLKDRGPHPYAAHLWDVHMLMLGGVSFEPELFDANFWRDIGLLRQLILIRTGGRPF